MTGRRALLALAGALLAPLSSTGEEPATTGEPPPDAGEAAVEAPAVPSLEELRAKLADELAEERRENRERELAFEQERDRQRRLLEEALAQVEQEQRRSERLEAIFKENEAAITSMDERREQRLFNLGELFGVVRQVANDTQGHVWDSVTSSQIPDRSDTLDDLGRSTTLPSTEDLERLWFELHREMTQQGRVARYPALVLDGEGGRTRREVTRAGVFAALADGEYLMWDADAQKLRELERQPPARYLGTARRYLEAGDGAESLAVDPSRGVLLLALTDTPSPSEQLQQGGAVGYVILAIGVLALGVGIAKWLELTITGRKVHTQRARDGPSADNPLGRILGVHEDHRNVDSEMLELKLDEAVLRESTRLERFLWLVKAASVIAPLLGLLGTVTGMVQTFQAITLFGAGDPRMMAGGISEALVTTMLGLTTAIPLVLLHATLSNRSRSIIDVLDESSTALVAARAEARIRPAAAGAAPR